MSRSRTAAATMALGLGLLLNASAAPGQATLPPDAAIGPPVADVGPVPIPESGPLRSAPRVDGTVSPGLRVNLDGTASSGGKLWYKWLQTQGPKVTLINPGNAVARFTVPADAARLGFVLVVGNDSGVDARPVTVEVENPGHVEEDLTLRADAGDDQAGKVGRRVTLNGVRSEPRGKLRYRWIQTGGPKVTLPATDGPTCSFVPPAAGQYRFSLVVATPSGHLSEPSTVSVAVGGTARVSATDPDGGPPMAIDELARVALSSIDGGTMYADDLSKIFDAVADRMETYRSYTDAANEMTRRLDVVVPRDKDRRAVWVENLFAPVMARVVAGMKDEGIDLTRPEAQTKPLNSDQRARLAEQFRFTAAGLRSTQALR
ncbi:PKD domain-containing protein [Tundrisphaera sp. TA3]|uniref:PKD domain-containing protein n=1 Tax=Tundrisphaera sp. TA3 TaxID=3435775 RepID=UPI003EBFA557